MYINIYIYIERERERERERDRYIDIDIDIDIWGFDPQFELAIFVKRKTLNVQKTTWSFTPLARYLSKREESVVCSSEIIVGEFAVESPYEYLRQPRGHISSAPS